MMNFLGMNAFPTDSREPSETPTEKSDDTEVDGQEPERIEEHVPEDHYPLKRYMRHAWFYVMTLGQYSQPSPGRTIWPALPELQRYDGTRQLRKVLQLPWELLNHTTDHFLYNLPETTISYGYEGRARLMLADHVLHEMEDFELEVLQEVDNVREISALVRRLVLETVTEVLRLYAGWQIRDPRLRIRRDFALCGARNAPWDILTLDGNHATMAAIVVVCLHPSLFKIEDFVEFTRPHDYERGALDFAENGPNQNQNITDILWAVLSEACMNSESHHFLVTTYQHWAFGVFSDNWLVGQVTTAREAPMHTWDDTPTLAARKWQGHSLLEMLTYWLAASKGIVASIGLPLEYVHLGPDVVRIQMNMGPE